MLQSFKLAIKSIIANKMRSFLTMLGLIIGVSAVVILVSVMMGYMNNMVKSFMDMGANTISVNLVNMPARQASVDQMYDFFNEHRDIFSEMTPQVSVSGTIKVGSEKTTTTTVSGVSEYYGKLKNYKLEKGRFLSYADMVSRQKVVVIGYYVASKLFGSPKAAIGETIKINGSAFTVVGVVQRQDKTQLSARGSDDFAFMPYSTAGQLNGTSVPDYYIFATVNTQVSNQAVELLKDFLKTIYTQKETYFVQSMSQMLGEINTQLALMSTIIGAIAGISLLVAGVGVMNIMLVSVTERTREIGIRKALGARKGVILQPFVIEALVTSTLGGSLGIILGCIASPTIGRFMNISSPANLNAVIISFSVSVAIGLIFGYMPAMRAASLNPIDALRSE